MIKPPMILTRRSVFRAGVGLAVVATAMPVLTPASARAEGASPSRRGTAQRRWLLSFQDRRLPGDRDFGRLWADTDPADPRHERL